MNPGDINITFLLGLCLICT